MKKEFRYTGETVSLDNHKSDYYESTNWIICIWNDKVFNSKQRLQGELENNNSAFHFMLNFEDKIEICRTKVSYYDGLGKTYIEGYHNNFPVPKYVCDFIRSMKDTYIITNK